MCYEVSMMWMVVCVYVGIHLTVVCCEFLLAVFCVLFVVRVIHHLDTGIGCVLLLDLLSRYGYVIVQCLHSVLIM